MKATFHRTAKAPTPVTARSAQRKLEAVLHALRPDALELFSDREEDAAEYEGIVRGLAAARDQALSAERHN